MYVYLAPVGRLLAVEEANRAGKAPNRSPCAREWEHSSKTDQLDVEFLHRTRGAPIEFDPRQGD